MEPLVFVFHILSCLYLLRVYLCCVRSFIYLIISKCCNKTAYICRCMYNKSRLILLIR
uniref:HL02501p n=1 Tax=Drosophila melanogaster TaxID=7227 RepID=Q95S09_DROME|nr:HL02501p [Drosophila melanogaster]